MESHAKILNEAVAAVRDLPPESQQVIAREMIDRARDFSQSQLTAEQDAEVARRLNGPPNYADQANVADFFARHGAVS